MSRPPRGVRARRRKGGAGCGTRERGLTQTIPRAALGEPPRGTRDRGPVRLAVKGKSVDAAWRVERTRAHPLMRQGPGVPGPPSHMGRSGEIQAMRLLGAPLPSSGRRKERRADPKPSKKPGSMKLALFDPKK